MCLAKTKTHALHKDKIETATERDIQKKARWGRESERVKSDAQNKQRTTFK